MSTYHYYSFFYRHSVYCVDHHREALLSTNILLTQRDENVFFFFFLSSKCIIYKYDYNDQSALRTSCFVTLLSKPSGFLRTNYCEFKGELEELMNYTSARNFLEINRHESDATKERAETCALCAP